MANNIAVCSLLSVNKSSTFYDKHKLQKYFHEPFELCGHFSVLQLDSVTLVKSSLLLEIALI